MQAGEWQVHGERPDNCEGPISRGQWDRLPISVQRKRLKLASETKEAIATFNRAVGLKMFNYEGTNGSPDVAIVPGGGHPFADAAALQWSDETGRHRGLVKAFNGLERRDRPDILMHELGHLVGLRHDSDNKLSIMFPGISSRVARLEAQDISALRYLYLR